MKIIITILALAICTIKTNSICAQQKICLDFKTQFASAGLNTEGSINSIENNSPFFNQNSICGGLNYKIGKYFGIGFYVSDQKTRWKFSNNTAIPLNNGDYIKWDAETSVQVQAISGILSCAFPLKKTNRINWYISSGYSYGNVKPIGKMTEFKYHEPQLTLSVENEKEPYSSVFSETGLSFKTGKRIILNTFLGYNYSLNTIFDGNYYLLTNSSNGSSHLSSNGSGFNLGASVTYVLLDFKKKEKKKIFPGIQ